MMLACLKVRHFRNLADLHICPQPGINLVIGANGSGKTSLLESIYYLSMGRSFRTHRNAYVIQHRQEKCTLFGEVVHPNAAPVAMGIERSLQGKCTMRLQKKEVFSRAAMARNLPIQLMDTNSHDIVMSGPRFRRQFLDWGVFHVEPLFFDAWRRYQRALKQRNTALKQRSAIAQILLWNEALQKEGEVMDQQRADYWSALLPIFTALWKQLMPNIPLLVEYQRGWPQGQLLSEVLRENLSRDQLVGYTQRGAHKADVLFSFGDVPAAQVLSQGQQKMLVYALKLAQGALLSEHGRPCVYLIDDLAAELDRERRMQVLTLLNTMGSQVFLTATSAEELGMAASGAPGGKPLAMFHVEQGRVEAQ